MASNGDRKAKLEAIFLLKRKGEPRLEIEEGYLKENWGLEGDAYAGPGDRQIPIYCSAGRERLSAFNDGLCFSRFLETLRFSGLDTASLATGDRIEAGEASLEVSGARKKCFSECPIVQRGERCDLATAVRFCRVVTSGRINCGSPIEIEAGIN
jgi:MOSC domain-containing protein YiiM